MPTSIPQLPDYPVTVFAEKENRKRISPGSGEVVVTDKQGKTKELKNPLVVDDTVTITGVGGVTITETTDKPPRPKRPSEKKKASAKKAPAKKSAAKKGAKK